ncbi:MAG: response regulator [Actinobacteria bacterium]|nr:response regulator [Actinomycetota bacterium]
MRVLIVSEDPAVRSRAATALHLHGEADVVHASGAEEAHALVTAGSFDVIVMDGDLSPEGGFSVLYEIRAQGELRGELTPPAVVMAGRADDRWLGDWAGANVVLVKPVDPFVLAARVAELVGAAPAPADAGDESGGEVRAARHDGIAPGT